MPVPDKCDKCFFVEKRNAGKYYCHKNPPVNVQIFKDDISKISLKTMFPEVGLNNWCGEFTLK